jgi:MHS family proline/betaine transporter-like MFS transporter
MLGIRKSEALDINTISMLVVMVIITISGRMSDRLGRRPLLLSGSAGILLLAWPMFRLMHRTTFSAILTGRLALAAIIGLYM